MPAQSSTSSRVGRARPTAFNHHLGMNYWAVWCCILPHNRRRVPWLSPAGRAPVLTVHLGHVHHVQTKMGGLRARFVHSPRTCDLATNKPCPAAEYGFAALVSRMQGLVEGGKSDKTLVFGDVEFALSDAGPGGWTGERSSAGLRVRSFMPLSCLFHASWHSSSACGRWMHP